MTENHDDMKLISAREHAARSLSKPPQVFLYRHGLYAFGEAPLTEGVKRATHHPGSAWGPLACPDCNFVRRGPMLDADLRAVVEQTLGERWREPVPCFGTLADLQAAMAEYPLTVGSAEELAWHVAETNALRQIRPDAPAASRRGCFRRREPVRSRICAVGTIRRLTSYRAPLRNGEHVRVLPTCSARPKANRLTA